MDLVLSLSPLLSFYHIFFIHSFGPLIFPRCMSLLNQSWVLVLHPCLVQTVQTSPSDLILFDPWTPAGSHQLLKFVCLMKKEAEYLLMLGLFTPIHFPFSSLYRIEAKSDGSPWFITDCYHSTLKNIVTYSKAIGKSVCVSVWERRVLFKIALYTRFITYFYICSVCF